MKINQDLTKLYYSIGEVSEMFGVKSSLLRFWETEFRALKPKKNRRGDRQYQVKDIRTIERIYTLVKERAFTLEGAKAEMRKKSFAEADNKDIVLNKLMTIKKGLISLKEQLSKNI